MITKDKFIEKYWGEVASRNWTAVVLHDWEKIPHAITSDIDYVISGPRPSELVCLISDYCETSGWSLIQIIEHEVDALYCVCFQKEDPFECVLLDVTWDYRRKGFDLVSNEILIRGCWMPEGKPFNVPAPSVEFLYRLIKAAAKGKDLKEVEGPLRKLADADSEGCQNVLKEVTGRNFGGEEGSFFSRVQGEFLSDPYFQKIRSGRKFGIREFRLYTKRILEPTGLIVELPEGITDDVIEAVGEKMGKGFRTTRIEVKRGSWISDWVARRKSVLVLRKGSAKGDLLLEEATEVGEICVKIVKFLANRVEVRKNGYR